MHDSVVMESMPGSQQASSLQHDSGGVDCGGMVQHMSGCDLACQPMINPVNNETRKIRNTNSYLLFDPISFLAISPVTIERPPKHFV